MSSFVSLLIAYAFVALLMVVIHMIQFKMRNVTFVDVVRAVVIRLTGCFYAVSGAGDS
jgi:hypothetical protein